MLQFDAMPSVFLTGCGGFAQFSIARVDKIYAPNCSWLGRNLRGRLDKTMLAEDDLGYIKKASGFGLRGLRDAALLNAPIAVFEDRENR